MYTYTHSLTRIHTHKRTEFAWLCRAAICDRAAVRLERDCCGRGRLLQRLRRRRRCLAAAAAAGCSAARHGPASARAPPITPTTATGCPLAGGHRRDSAHRPPSPAEIRPSNGAPRRHRHRSPSIIPTTRRRRRLSLSPLRSHAHMWFVVVVIFLRFYFRFPRFAFSSSSILLPSATNVFKCVRCASFSLFLPFVPFSACVSVPALSGSLSFSHRSRRIRFRLENIVLVSNPLVSLPSWQPPLSFSTFPVPLC